MESEQHLPPIQPRRRKRKQTQILKLSKEARVAVWIIMGLLGVVVVIEWHASSGYHNTLSRFRQRLFESETGAPFTLFEVRTTVSGFPSNLTTRESGRQVVIYNWFSLFRHYQIGLTLGIDNQVVVALRTGGEAPVDLQERPDYDRVVDDDPPKRKSFRSPSRSTKKNQSPESVAAQTQSFAPGDSAVDVPDEIAQQADSTIVTAVRKRFQATPVTPIPSLRDRRFTATESLRLDDWLKSGILDCYNNYGHTNPKWDESAREFLQNWWNARHGEFPLEDRLKLVETAKTLIDDGCDDPLVLYAYAESLENDGIEASQRRATDILRKATTRFADSTYPPSISIEANMLYARLAPDYMDWRPLIVETYLMSAADGLIDSLAKKQFLRDERRILLQQINRLLDGELQYRRVEFLKRVKARWDIDPWFTKLLMATEHMRIGWIKRPKQKDQSRDAFVGTDFHAHWCAARALLLEAWQLHRELPEAAIELIEVTSVIGGVAQETPRFWFDQAIRCQFDEIRAYDALLYAISPRWGGSHSQMIEFGRECLATRRFDTQVPLQFHSAIQDAAPELENPDSIFEQQGIFQDYEQMLNGYAAHTDIESERQFHLSQLACVAYLAGQSEESAKLLQQLGNKVESRAFATFGVTLPAVQRELSSTANQQIPFAGHRGSVTGMSYLPGESILLTTGTDGTVRFWNAETGKQELMLRPHAGAVTALAISPDGTQFVTGDANGFVKLQKYPKHEVEFTLEHGSKVLAIAYSPDGRYLITGGETMSGIGEVRLWDAVYGDKLATIDAHKSAIQTLVFSGDGNTFVSGAGTSLRSEFSSGKLILWNTAKRNITRMIDPFSGGVLQAEYSPDGQKIAVAGMHRSKDNSILTNEVQLIEAGTGETIHSFTGHWYEITSLEFSTDGDLLFTCSRDRTIRVWDTRLGEQVAVLMGHNAPITRMTVSRKRSQLLTADRNGRIKKWNIDNSKIVSRTDAPLLDFVFQGVVDRLQFIRDGRFLVTSDRFSGVTIWDAASGFQSGRTLRDSPTLLTTASAISPDASTIATAVSEIGQENGHILLWNVEDGSILLRLTGSVGAIGCVEFSPDGKTLATAGENREIWLWDVETETASTWTRLKAHTDRVTSLAFSPDGTTLASGAADQTVRIWKIPRVSNRNDSTIQSRVLSDRFPQPIASLRFSGDGRSLLCSTRDTTEHWNTTMSDSTYSVAGAVVAFSPDFTRFATGGGKLDSEAQIWNADSGQEITRLIGGHDDSISSITFTPNGKYVLTAGRDFSIKCWDAETGNRVFDLNALRNVPSGD